MTKQPIVQVPLKSFEVLGSFSYFESKLNFIQFFSAPRPLVRELPLPDTTTKSPPNYRSIKTSYIFQSIQ